MVEDKTVVVHKKQHKVHAALVAEYVGGTNLIVPTTGMYDFLEDYDDCVITVLALTVEDADRAIYCMCKGKARGAVIALDIPDRLMWLLHVPLLGKYYLNRRRVSAEFYAFLGH